MKIRKAERKQSKIRVAMQGPSGSGKTYSSLLLAKGLVKDLRKVVLIDTECGSADLYAHLGPFSVLPLSAPFTPEKYIEALELCEKSGAECIIVDSLSPAWEYLLDLHSKMQGNSFTNWGRLTPRQKSLVHKILTSPVHIIATMRTKQDYVINLKNGKHVPEKIGLKAIQRDGIDYEFTLVFNLDINHLAKCTKDRTDLYRVSEEFTISVLTGEQILDWCTRGVPIEQVRLKIEACKSLEELTKVYEQYTAYYQELKEEFSTKKLDLQNATLHQIKSNQNGITNAQ